MRSSSAVILVVGATLAIQALATMISLAPAVFATQAAAALGVDAGAIGLYTAMVYAASAYAAGAGGGVVGRLGALRLSQLCLLAAALGLAGAAVGQLALFALGALAIGLGYGPVTPASSHLLVRWTPASWRAFVFSVKQTGVPLGGALAGAVVPPLVVLWDWRVAAVAVALAGVVLALALEPMRRRFDEPSGQLAAARPGARAALAVVLADPALRRLAWCSFFFSAAQLCLATFIVAFLERGVGWTLVEAGIALATAQVAGIVGRLVWGAAADRLLPAGRLLAWLGIAMGLAGLATGSIGAGWPAAAVFAIAATHGATAIGWNGLYLAEVARLAPGATGLATGGALMLTFAGVMVGPPAFSAVLLLTGSYRLAFWMVSLAALAAGAACFGVPARRVT